jgi:MFS family permease|tara:strand:+ start:1538 stop:3361 length:1824 start_codon:yes stop_codon:yes gene_type:complete
MFRSSSLLSFSAIVGKREKKLKKKTKNKMDDEKKKKQITTLDWTTVIAIQSCSLISIMSSTFIFSTGIFMVKNFDRNNTKEDEAKAALRCGLLIASKPFFSAMSSYMWGRSGDRIGFKLNILVSVIFVAAINLAFGFAETYAQAVWVRSLSGFFDGIVVLVKPSLSLISDRTNANRAFGTTGLAYGLGTSIAPAIASFLAFPCTSWKMYDTKNEGGKECPALFEKYPFVLSSSWITIVAVPAFVFALVCMKIVPPTRAAAAAVENSSREDIEKANGFSKSFEMVETGKLNQSIPEVEEEEEEDDDDDGESESESGGENDKLVSIPLIDDESDDFDDSAEHAVETVKLIQEKDSSSSFSAIAAVPMTTSTTSTTTDASSFPSAKTGRDRTSIWILLKDEDIYQAISLQIMVTMNVLTGTEITPIWLATSIENGGLGWKTQDIGVFGTVMGVTIMSFQLFAFVKLTDKYGIVRLVTWALFLSALVYPCHSIANSIARVSKPGAWAMVVSLGMIRGSLGPIMMGGISLIVNNAAPRESLGVVNGFAGTFSNLSRALAPLVGGSLIAVMASSPKDAFMRNWYPFLGLGFFFLVLGWYSMRLSRRLDVPRMH